MFCQQSQGADEEEGDVCAENRRNDGLNEAQPPARQIGCRQGGAETEDAHAVAPEGGGGGLEAGVGSAASAEQPPEEVLCVLHRHL